MRGRTVSSWLPVAGLAVAMVAAAGLIIHLTRGTTFWFDEWNFLLYRRSGVHSLLTPYNGHLSLVPELIYRALLDISGVDYLPFRIFSTGCQLAVAGLVFVYARRRLGGRLAVMAAALILFMGAGWQDILWPFQIAWLISIAAGIGALLLLDRGDRAGAVASCGLLIISITSTTVGVAVVLGAAADLVLSRRRWREGWIAAVPLVLYVAWTVGYQGSLASSPASHVPSWIIRSAAAGISSLAGLTGQSFGRQPNTISGFGVALTVLVLAGLAWRAVRGRTLSARAAALAVILLAFWVSAAIGRGLFGTPYLSRYEYVDGVFMLLFAIELAGAVHLKPVLTGALAVLTAAAVYAGIGPLRDGGDYLRGQAPRARGDLAALDLARPSVPPGYVAGYFPGVPFLAFRARAYFALRRSVGTPAYTAAQLSSAPEIARTLADHELLRIYRVSLSSPPGGRLVTGPCRRFTGASAGTGAAAGAQLTLPASGLLIHSAGRPVTVMLRRFGVAFTPVGTLAADSRGVLRIPSDAAPAPWRVSLGAPGPFVACPLT